MDRSCRPDPLLRFFGPIRGSPEQGPAPVHPRRPRRPGRVRRRCSATRSSPSAATTGYPGTDDAEVAFVVEDAHQGRGIGSVLLEHLAAAARERGIKRFVAEVLAENSRMVRVFRDAGYEAERAYEDGVVHLTFPIDADRGRRSAVARARAAHRGALDRPAAHPASVAVVGASNDEGKIGNALLRQPARDGFAGPVYPVNPGARHVARRARLRRASRRSPTRSTSRSLAVPADEVAGVVEAVPAQAGARPGRRLRRVRRDAATRAGAAAERAAGRARPGRTACGWSARTASASSTPTRRCG